MIITAYSVLRSADVSSGYVAIAGFSPDYVTAGVRIYADNLFQNFIEASDGESWIYDNSSPVNVSVDDYPGLETYGALTKNPLKTYGLATYDNVNWCFFDGQFYKNSGPAGAYQITDGEHNALVAYVNRGKSLAWYANQRPYVYESWTRPNYTSNTNNPDGTIFTASSEYTYAGNVQNHAYRAMDGIYSINDLANYQWSPAGFAAAWWQVSLLFKIRIKTLIHVNNRPTVPSRPIYKTGIQGQYFADSEGTLPIGNFFNSGAKADAVWYTVYDSETSIITNVIRLVRTAPAEGNVDDDDYFSTAGIREVILTADKIIYEAEER